ncbi:MAG: DUF4082 domain-containing protein [Fimbriimonadaceae bacterium]
MGNIPRLVTVLTAFALVGFAVADYTAVSLTPDQSNTLNDKIGYSLGYEFTVGSSAITVTSLGYFDPQLTAGHAVGIFDTSGNLLLSGTVPTTAIDVNNFSYTSTLSGSAALSANTSYVISAVSGTVDDYTFNPSVFATDSDITLVQSRYALSSTLTFPNQTDSTVVQGYFGPNFTFVRPSSTPEPFTMGLGLAGVAIAARRRMKSKAQHA